MKAFVFFALSAVLFAFALGMVFGRWTAPRVETLVAPMLTMPSIIDRMSLPVGGGAIPSGQLWTAGDVCADGKSHWPARISGEDKKVKFECFQADASYFLTQVPR